LAAICEYSLIDLGEHPAVGNTTDGWNVYCVLQKTKEEFITFEQFKECGIKKNSGYTRILRQSEGIQRAMAYNLQ
jgi:hypothetical protein